MISFDIRGRGFKPVNLDWWSSTQKQWAPVLLKDNKTYWGRQANPNNGRPWAPLSPKYREWKQKRASGQPILKLTGEMQGTAKIVPQKSGFEVQTTSYGRYHQFGTGRLVARPWVGVPQNSIKQLTTIAWKNILR